jgi:hypothetical protein
VLHVAALTLRLYAFGRCPRAGLFSTAFNDLEFEEVRPRALAAFQRAARRISVLMLLSRRIRAPTKLAPRARLR